MFKKILIANRGEIAVRIIRTCREMGIETVTIYSEADRDALHVQMADESICVGPAKTADSYLNMENIISATVLSGAEAIHPGFGFLSENSKFAKMCKECKIVFIGPTGEQMDQMGNKSQARKTMIKAGVPVVPGSDGLPRTCEVFKQLWGHRFSYYDKALRGGGRGIELPKMKKHLPGFFCSNGSPKCFGDPTMYIEKYIENPVILNSNSSRPAWNVIHEERDCSIQRRHQKSLKKPQSSHDP